MKFANLTRETILAETMEVAGTWASRLRGLLFKKSLPTSHGLILQPCNSVHTCFMQFNIDVLFVDHAGKVVYLIKNMSSFRFSPMVKKAEFVVELPAGTIELTGTSLNDRVGTVAEII